MQKIRSQAVPYPEHPALSLKTAWNWEDLRVFLAVGRHMSFRAAADELGLSFNTVRRHVERLEHASKLVLLARHANGVEPTREGRELLASARIMEEAAAHISRMQSGATSVISGRVQISVTEGLGTYWLVPRLIPFQRNHSKIVLDVNCTFRAPDVARMEADIAIQLGPPRQAGLKAVRLGIMHVMPFASPEYLRTYGTPKTLRDVENHKIVEQLSPQLDVSAVDRLFPNKKREGFVALSTNTSTAHLWAVIRGAGIGMLPTYLSWLGARIVPIDLDLRVRHEIWLSYHPDAKRQRRVALAIDWIKDCFSSGKFPWFADEFLHPNDLRLSDESSVELNHFSGLLS
jgi:DNA-binding transcriptional LysR family regulator